MPSPHTEVYQISLRQLKVKILVHIALYDYIYLDSKYMYILSLFFLYRHLLSYYVFFHIFESISEKSKHKQHI